MKTSPSDWFFIADVDRLDTPALVVFPERIKHNLETLKNGIDDVGRLRPHVKTHKCKEAAMLTMMAGINKFKCATIAEAEMLGMCNAADVLLAYQPVGPKLNRFISLISNYPLTKYACLVDNADIAKEISTVALNHQLLINVYIDINTGMNRTGIHPAGALQLFYYCNNLEGINPVGLHVYDGHIHQSEFAMRRLHCDVSYKPVDDIVQQLHEDGFYPVIIAGGTPTFPIHASRKAIECSPGTFIYWDDGYMQAFAEQEFLPAALVVSRIVSLPDEAKICVDLGHKSVAAEDVLSKRVRFLNAPDLKPHSQSEEHLVLEAGKNHQYKIGDVLYGLPYHICPTVALYESAITIENNHVTGEWKTIARNRTINF